MRPEHHSTPLALSSIRGSDEHFLLQEPNCTRPYGARQLDDDPPPKLSNVRHHVGSRVAFPFRANVPLVEQLPGTARTGRGTSEAV